MTYCTHYNQPTCVRAPLRASDGICAKCSSFTDSGTARTPLTIAATSKAPLPKPVPRAEWPTIAKQIAWMRSDDEIGIGSTLERLIGYVGGGLYKEAFKMLTGKSCGCTDRRKHLDERYPYNQA